jgi:uncharacterized phage-associated protein
MIPNHRKEKAFNAITFFLNNTSLCNKKKTYKLLFIFDFEHFQQTGRSVTGYEYFAWDMGPVPKELHKAIQNNDAELLEHFNIEKQECGGYEAITLKNKMPFEERFFSRRELDLLKDIADRFHMMTGKEMEDYTHTPGRPWDRVYNKENNKDGPIPYEYQLDGLNPTERDVVLSIAEERETFLNNYQ